MAQQPHQDLRTTNGTAMPIKRETKLLKKGDTKLLLGPPPAPPLRLLVVDDNHGVADTLGAMLQFLGHTARAVYDGFTALQTVAFFQPEVILLDIEMPGLDGYAVAQQLRQLPSSREAILVAMTGYADLEDQQRASAAGFDYHLTKPFELSELRQLLARVR